jgi:hypothetical protein
MVECLYCRAQLKGFADSRIVVIHGQRFAACADIPACEARNAEAERHAMGIGPAPLSTAK